MVNDVIAALACHQVATYVRITWHIYTFMYDIYTFIRNIRLNFFPCGTIFLFFSFVGDMSCLKASDWRKRKKT